MNNQNSKLSVGLAMLFELILIVTAIISTVSRQWKNITLTLLAMVCLVLPFITKGICNKKNIVLPSSFEIIMLLFIFLAQYLGEIKKFYQIFWWWDLLLHAIFGSYSVIIALYSIRGITRKVQDTTNQGFTLFAIIFAFCFSIALGTLWEMFEYMGDYLLNTNMVKGGLEDTSTDLLVKILAAFITAIIYYNRSLKRKTFYS